MDPVNKEDATTRFDDTASGSATQPVDRSTRAGEERHLSEDRNLTDPERLEVFKQRFAQAELPDIPPIPGFHVCWLTTTNPRDPVHGRLRLGYELLRAEEVPGYEYVSLKTGEYAGCIGINEMVAAKLPEALYQMFMQSAHHDQPMEQANDIYESLEDMQQRAAEHKANVKIDGGFDQLKADTRIAHFD